MLQDAEHAKKIATSVLECSGSAMMRNDFSAFLGCFHIPHQIETFDGETVIRHEHELEAKFIKMRENLMKLGVTDYVRHVVAAEFQDENTISTTHETRPMSGRLLVTDPYPTYSTLQKIDGAWKVTDSKYATTTPELLCALSGD